ncbi:MAG: hypothetical protein HUU28_02975, partial [Planctomycetaceae bacterium]|nr:hypothetical protein [Planctomycetaceae bacterium]
FARGVVGGALALFERAPWLGEIAAGLTLLTALLTALHLWMRASDARELERLRKEHDDGDTSGPHRGKDT